MDLNSKFVPPSIQREKDTIFLVEQAISRSEDTDHYDFIKLTGVNGIDTPRYVSRKTLIQIRDAINAYLWDEGDEKIDSNGEVLSKPTNEEPELELRFS